MRLTGRGPRHRVVLGVPGSYAATMRRAAWRRAAPWVVASVVCWLLAAAAVVRAVPVLVALAVGAAVLLWRAAGEPMRQAAIAGAGITAERAAASALRRVRVDVVMFGTLLGAGGDADVIVLGPSAAVVEVKAGAGLVTGTATGLARNGRPMRGDAAGQAHRQADALEAFLGRPVVRIVCVSRMTNPTFRHRGVVVCSARDLPRVISALPASLAGVDPRTAAAALSAMSLAEEALRASRRP